MNYSAGERPYRMRSKARDEPAEGDTASVALTAQVILCILMLVSALIMRNSSAEDFDILREQYKYMLSEDVKSERISVWLAERSGIFGGFLQTLDQYIAELKPKKEPFDLSGAEDEPVDEPELPTPEAEAQKPAQAEYNYLGDEGVQHMLASGGMFPATGNENGMAPAPKGSLLSPVYLGSKIKPPLTGLITSGFSYRYHPVTGASDFHTGIDVASPEGSDIAAALPGTVVEVGESQIYGNYIVLEHAANLKTSYSHCSEIIAEEGMRVRQGERIALVGETGVATGPHLHFSVIADGDYVDPEWILADYIKLVE